ncbi:MAG: phytanoyl-CoA dioxygenase family protein [Polyangiaceae bacterium]
MLELARALDEYRARGFARLGRVLDDDALAPLRERADDLMLGRVVHAGMFFQHDAESGRYEDLALGKGYIGPSLEYRKLEKLELDERFRGLVELPLFERIARLAIEDADSEGVALYRSVLFSKSARGGSDIPWHQDGGRLWGLDRTPTLQIWVALDDAPEHGGCLEFYPESHLGGLATPLGGVIPSELIAAREAARALPPRELVPARAGEALLVHNLVWHRSGRSASGAPRRAVTTCYISGATRCVRQRRAPRSFVRLWQHRDDAR